jgi:hypothetical protein
MNGVGHITDQDVVRRSARPTTSTALTGTLSRAPAQPRWQLETIAAIKELTKLGDNWDGYGSPAIDGDVLVLAEHVMKQIREECIPTAHVGPESGGAVQIEWELSGRGLELHILRDLSIEYLRSTAGEPGDSGVLRGQTIAEIVDGVRHQVHWLVRG